MITDKNYYKKVGKRIAIFILTLLMIYIFFKLSIFYIPFLIAFIISLFIEPLIKKVMQVTNLTRKSSAIITLIIVFAIIIGLLIWGISSAIAESTSIINELNNNMSRLSSTISNLLANFNLDNIKIPNQIKNIIINTFNSFMGEGTNLAQKILSEIINIVKHTPQLLIYIGITILATYFVCTDKMYILDQIEHHVPRNWVSKFANKIKKVISSLKDYLKAQIILILISFAIVLIGLSIFDIVGLNVKYPVIIALTIGFVDALPIVGSGTVMVPWAIISAFYGDIKLAISLIVLYIIVIITRQMVEPKIVSNHIGIHPIFTIISMYTGFKLIGVLGLFLGPIILIILKNVFETMIDNGVIKTILDRK